jgi:uncharacterized protein YggE
MRCYRFCFVLLVLLWLVCPADLQAQYGWMQGAQSGGSTVAGVGQVTIHPKPSAIRMHIELVAKGKTLEEALANLKDRREAALVQLESLRADMDSVEVNAPRVSGQQSEQKRRLERMLMERMRSRGGKVPPGVKAPKSFSVSAALSAEWPLKVDDAERLLMAAEVLREKVKEADLAGTKEAEKLSPEEEELAEEMAGMSGSYGEEEIKPGEPQFVYVAEITDAERDKAMAEAFTKAKAQAERLARAANVKLGPLVGLGGGGGGQTQFGETSYGYQQRQYLQRLMGARAGAYQDDSANESVSTSPESLSFNFNVTATFALEKEE